MHGTSYEMKLKEVAEKVETQKQMISVMEKLLSGKSIPKLFQKSGTFQARKGVIGEQITTIIDGEEETKKTVKSSEVVVKGPKGEFYVISEKKFNDRYEVDKALSDDFQAFKASGLIRAYEYKGDSFKFMASWDEEMLCKDGDFLASPVMDQEDKDVTEVYRIERSVFDKTYKEKDS